MSKTERNLKSELLHKFFRGECTPKQAHEVLVWINSDEGKAAFEKLFDSFREEQSGSSLDSKKMLSNIHKRLAEESLVNDVISQENGAAFQVSPGGKSPQWKSIWKVAAAVSLLIVATVLTLLHGELSFFDQTSEQVAEIVTKRTETGQKLTIHLSDGSVAILNAHSSISYPKEFSDTLRSVQVAGEVFFEVTKNKDKPFVVTTTQLRTTVLGTSFNVKAREDHYQQVSLLTGKVQVDALEKNETAYLVPGEEITFSNNHITKGTFDRKTKALWKDGIIYFENTPLSECFETLELWYGVKINVENDRLIADKKVSGRFDKDYLANVLNSISYAHEFEYEINKERVYIRFTQ